MIPAGYKKGYTYESSSHQNPVFPSLTFFFSLLSSEIGLDYCSPVPRRHRRSDHDGLDVALGITLLGPHGEGVDVDRTTEQGLEDDLGADLADERVGLLADGAGDALEAATGAGAGKDAVEGLAEQEVDELEGLGVDADARGGSRGRPRPTSP